MGLIRVVWLVSAGLLHGWVTDIVINYFNHFLKGCYFWIWIACVLLSNFVDLVLAELLDLVLVLPSHLTVRHETKLVSYLGSSYTLSVRPSILIVDRWRWILFRLGPPASRDHWFDQIRVTTDLIGAWWRHFFILQRESKLWHQCWLLVALLLHLWLRRWLVRNLFLIWIFYCLALPWPEQGISVWYAIEYLAWWSLIVAVRAGERMRLCSARITNADELVRRIIELLDSVGVVSLVGVRNRCRAVLFFAFDFGLGVGNTSNVRCRYLGRSIAWHALAPHRIVASPKMACTSRHLGLIVLVACGLYQLLHGTAILQVRIFRCVDLVQLWLVLSSPGCTIYTWFLPFVRVLRLMRGVWVVHLTVGILSWAYLVYSIWTALPDVTVLGGSVSLFYALGLLWKKLWKVHGLWKDNIILIKLDASGLVCFIGLSVLFHLKIQFLLPVELLSGVSGLPGADLLDLCFLLLLLVLA